MNREHDEIRFAAQRYRLYTDDAGATIWCADCDAAVEHIAEPVYLDEIADAVHRHEWTVHGDGRPLGQRQRTP